MEAAMIAPVRPGVTLAQPQGPVIETARLRLRQWRSADMAPYTAMLADPGTARFITVDGKPVVDEMTGWRHAIVMAGHWALHGAGMFVVEEKSSGKFAGRVGPWFPPTWPGFEVGWGIAPEFRGKGYAVEAARASIDWRLRISNSIKSSTASIAKTWPHRAWRGGSEPKRIARSNCSAMPRTCG
jgi:RimJ/RimL family protein N-acetyltransferase